VHIATTDFETLGRFNGAASGTGSRTLSIYGVELRTGTNSGSYANIGWMPQSINSKLFNGSPTISWSVSLSRFTGSGDAVVVLGMDSFFGTSFTYTGKHVGFRFQKSSGTVSLYATNGNGTAQTSTLLVSSVTAYDTYQLVVVMNGNSSIDFYYRVNDGSWSAKTTHTTNIPTGDNGAIGGAIKNDSAADYELIISGIRYQR